MTSIHIMSENIGASSHRNDKNDLYEFEDMPDEVLKPSSSRLGPPRGKQPPRWQENKKKRTLLTKKEWDQKSDSSSSKRKEFMKSIRQAVDLSFYMTSSSISSLGDGSITSTYDDADSVSSVASSKHARQSSTVLSSHSLRDGDDFTDRLAPLTSFRSSNSTDRWDTLASQDALPPSPFRRSFEFPNSSKPHPLPTRRASYASGDTLPRMPQRRGAPAD